MELVEGEDLAERIARGAIPIDEALPIARQIAEALEAAHEQGRNESQRVPIEIAAIHAARGEKEKALEWLSRGVGAGYKDYETLGRDPLFADLRSAPRFQAIRQQMQHAVKVMREGSADLRALQSEPVPSTRSTR
jgi:hypothetical protein